MKRICIICEGYTEVEFVKSCVVPYLLDHGAYAYPCVLQAPSGRHRGGRVTVERLVRFISHQYHHADRVTTFVDYYGFQDRAGRTRTQLEHAILEGLQHHAPALELQYILPYIQMYEFEGLLFSDIEQFQFVLDGWNPQNRAALLGIRQAFATPEDINDSSETAPSKRILSIFGGFYSKVEHGSLIAEAIGLDAIRTQCPQFDAWLERLQRWDD